LSKLRLKGELIHYKDADKYDIQLDNDERDVMFLLKPGYIFVPSFFEKHKGATKGMHGYFYSQCLENNGFLVSSIKLTKYSKNKSIKLESIMDIINKQLPAIKE